MSNIPNFNPAALENPFAAIEEIIKQYMNNYLFTCSFVRVVAVGEDNSFVDVEPVIENLTTKDEVLKISNNDIIHNVPMLTLFGGGCEISFVPAVGDKGLLIACKQDISNFKMTKETAVVGSRRQFSNSDGVFLPLFFENKQNGIVLKNADTLLNILPDSVNIITNRVSVMADTATVTASSVALGGEGGQGVARIGDQIEVEITGGSSAGKWAGTIVTGSGTVTST